MQLQQPQHCYYPSCTPALAVTLLRPLYNIRLKTKFRNLHWRSSWILVKVFGWKIVYSTFYWILPLHLDQTLKVYIFTSIKISVSCFCDLWFYFHKSKKRLWQHQDQLQIQTSPWIHRMKPKRLVIWVIPEIIRCEDRVRFQPKLGQLCPKGSN